MADPSSKLGPKPVILCFGVFEVDLALGEVRKQGALVRLQQKPFQVLAALLECPGEVVTRDEIRNRLWPSDEFGEFDLGINTAIRKIRRLLGDSAETPRFVETLPRVGYRFLASVECKALEMVAPVPRPLPTASKRSKSWQVALLVVGMAAVSVLGALIVRNNRPPDGIPLKVKPLTTYPGAESDPSLSPDGSQVAFAWNGEDGNIDLYVKVVGTERAVRLTTNPAADGAPAWSPDGRWIAFVRRHPRPQQNGTVFLISPLGGHEQEVADGVIRTAWTADSQSLLLLIWDERRERSRIERFSLSTHQRQTLTSTAEYTLIQYLAASPDGSKLAYTRCEHSVRCDLYLMPIAGGESRRLTYDRTGMAGVAWTVNSKQLIFGSSRSGISKLWRIESTATRHEPVQVAADQVGAAFPSSSRIAAGPVRLSFQKAMTTANIRRTEIRRSAGGLSIGESVLISPSTHAEVEPSYSPDGSKIAFSSTRSGEWELWISEVDGSNPRSLGRGLAGDLSWSPDGQFIASNCLAASPVDDEEDICVQSVRGGPVRRIVSSPQIETLPLWSRDGRWLYFTANYSKSMEIYKIPAAGGQSRRITVQGGIGGMESPDGGHIFFFRDMGGPGQQRPQSLWRMPSEGGPEQIVLEGLYPFFLSVEKEGIYFLRRDEPRKDQDTLFLWRYGSDPPVAIGPLPYGPRRAPTGLAVSPDGRFFLTMHQQAAGVDLMIIDNFR